MSKEDGVLDAPEHLRQRLQQMPGQIQAMKDSLDVQAAAQRVAFIQGAADHLGIELRGPEGWDYEPEYNRFRIMTAKRPGDRGWPPELPADKEVRPEQEVRPPQNGAGKQPEAVAATEPVKLPRRVRRAMERAEHG